jgi:hypothetical protein
MRRIEPVRRVVQRLGRSTIVQVLVLDLLILLVRVVHQNGKFLTLSLLSELVQACL